VPQLTETSEPEAPVLEGPCGIGQCPKPGTGYVVGADPQLLVCDDHGVEVTTLEYDVLPIPPNQP
jgi:hypothetical protein